MSTVENVVAFVPVAVSFLAWLYSVLMVNAWSRHIKTELYSMGVANNQVTDGIAGFSNQVARAQLCESAAFVLALTVLIVMPFSPGLWVEFFILFVGSLYIYFIGREIKSYLHDSLLNMGLFLGNVWLAGLMWART